MNIIINTTIWFLIGAFLLNIVVLIVFRTGVVYKSRKKDGTLKKKIPFAGVLSFLIMLIIMLTFFIVFDFFIFRNTNQIKYIWVLLINLLLMLLLDFYDAFVIDILVLTKWRPGFLRLGKELTSGSMKFHVKQQLTAGWFIKFPLILLSSALFYFLY